jgi:hypothetical protein
MSVSRSCRDLSCYCLSIGDPFFCDKGRKNEKLTFASTYCCHGLKMHEAFQCLRNLKYVCVSKSFRTGRLGRELQMVQLSATKCNCIAILWVSLVSFAAIILCVASQWVFIVVVCFVINSVRKLWIHPRTIKGDFTFTSTGSSSVIHTSHTEKQPGIGTGITKNSWIQAQKL